MMEGWNYIKLGDILHIKHGYGFKGEYFIDEPNHNFLLTPGNFAIGGGYKSDKMKYYDGPINEEFVLSAGDVIVTMTDLSKEADTLGYSAKIPNDSENTYLHNQRLGLVSLKTNKFDLDYIYWLLRTQYYQKHIAGSSSGATVKHTSPKKIYSTKLLVPKSKETQHKIGSILSAYDDLIENNLKRIVLLEEKAQLTYEEWFVRLKFPGHETMPINTETVLPEGWVKVKLSDIGEIVTGKTPSTSKEEYFNGDIPFIKTPNMSGFPYVMETSDYLTKKGADTQKKKYLPKNSLVVSCIGSAGKYALVAEDSQFNQQINAIKFSKEHYTFYTYCFAKYLKPLLDAIGSNGATMTNVNKSKFEKIEITKPDEELLKTFHSNVKLNFEAIYSLMKQNQYLKEARDILLPRLMGGIIDVEQLNLETLQSTKE